MDNRELTETDLHTIRRLLAAGAVVAAAKVFAGATDCGMTVARKRVAELPKGAVRTLASEPSFAERNHPRQELAS
jgi:hypothetical protein